MLQEDVLISYHRGTTAILDCKDLETASCRCYRDVNNIGGRALAENANHSPSSISESIV